MSFADPDNLPEGSRWLHLWTCVDERAGKLLLAMQYETVGVSITAAPCLAIDPSACLVLFDALATLPGIVRVPEGVSISLDPLDERE